MADTTKPVITITSPANGALICTDTTASYSCAYKLGGAKGATYRIEARAYDSSNNMSSSVITIGSSGSGGDGGEKEVRTVPHIACPQRLLHAGAVGDSSR